MGTNNIKLGVCPYCKSSDYVRDVRDCGGDFCSINCHCNHCDKDFTEYFGLDEIAFEEGENRVVYNGCLSEKDKRVLLEAMNLLIDTEGDTKDYSKILNILNGGLNEDS